MLVAHLVPGYLAATTMQARWPRTWTRRRRVILWLIALGSTVAPDVDVVYNAVFRGFLNHSTLWTHSAFAWAGLTLTWLMLRIGGRLPYARTAIGLAVLGWLSHLLLDAISHGTPLFYPLSLYMFGAPSPRVLEGGFWAYISDPIFLSEPLLIGAAAAHWISHTVAGPGRKRLALLFLGLGMLILSVSFLYLLPTLQQIAAVHGAR